MTLLDLSLPGKKLHMLHWIRALDRVLKGDVTKLSALQGGRIDLPLRGLSVVILVLGVIYGACMGIFAVVARWKTPTLRMGFEQLAASAGKVPALFFLTLLVTFPSLYVFNALVGSRLTLNMLLRLLIATLSVMLAVLASFGTIVVFFSLCTSSYPFMVLLNVVMFAVAGFLGLGFLLQTLHRLSIVQAMTALAPAPVPASTSAGPGSPEASTPAAPSAPPLSGALEHLGNAGVSGNVKTVFHLWLLLFGLVGAQMGWVLRPFIGNPQVAFTLFRHRESNFFEAVFSHLRHLLS